MQLTGDLVADADRGGYDNRSGAFWGFEANQADFFGMGGKSGFFVWGNVAGPRLEGQWHFESYGNSGFCKVAEGGEGEFRAVWIRD